LNSRRGQIQSMEDAQGVKVVRASVPLSEMFGYIGDLRSKTSGRAVYSMEFDSYAEVPKAVADEIIQKATGESALRPRLGPSTGSGAQAGHPTTSHSLSTKLRTYPVASRSQSSARNHYTTVLRRTQWPRPSSSGPSRTSTSVP